MSFPLAPWLDARSIADRAAKPGARMIVGLGAENWCGKYSVFRPHFDARAVAARDNEIWLWLNLEEHAEFLDDYIPEDLPQLIVYEGEAMTICHPLAPTREALEAALNMRHNNAIREIPESELTWYTKIGWLESNSNICAPDCRQSSGKSTSENPVPLPVLFIGGTAIPTQQ